MRWPKYWSFSFRIIPSKEIPELISFRMDWLDLRAVLSRQPYVAVSTSPFHSNSCSQRAELRSVLLPPAILVSRTVFGTK